MLRIYSVFLCLSVFRDLSGFIHEIDYEVGLPRAVRRAYNDFTNACKNNHWTSSGLERCVFELLPVFFRASLRRNLKA